MEIIIEVKNLWKSFNGRSVLKGINFSIKPHEFVAIIGPSGCGKTTLLKLMIGLLKPDRGEVVIDNKNLSVLNQTQLRQLRLKTAMVFQFSALFDWLSVEENVGFALKREVFSDKEIHQNIQAVLELVNLRNIEKLRPSELSGGMKKRVAIARALITAPEIIFYDEPTLSLDPANTASIVDLMKKIHEEKKMTSLLVTHQMGVVASLAERLLLLKNGLIEALSSGKEIIDLVGLFKDDKIEGGRNES